MTQEPDTHTALQLLMYSVDLRQLQGHQCLTRYRSSVDGKTGEGSMGHLSKIGRSVSTRIQGGGRSKCLASRVLHQTECLASKLVFGSTGLILGSSMAPIPIETISIFLEGKIHRYNL
jgi:hypothetical protein